MMSTSRATKYWMVLGFLLSFCQPIDSSSEDRLSRHLAPPRELSGQEEITGGDIFEETPNNVGNDSGNDSNVDPTANDPTCIFPDAYGDFGTENAYTDAALVAWTYQLQGETGMSSNTVNTEIIPALEREVSKLLLERLFATPVCNENDDQLTATSTPQMLRDGGARRERRIRQKQDRNLELKFWYLDNGSRVSGLLKEPQDSILPHFAGVNCRDAEFIPDAPRCYQLIGGLTLTGQQGNIDQAVNITQNALRTIFNQDKLLNSIHETLRNAHYVAPEPDYHVYFGGDGGEKEEPEEPSVESPREVPPANAPDDEGDSDKWPIWPWIVIGSCVVLMVVAAYFVRQRRQGSFGQIRSHNGALGLLSLQRSSDESNVSGSTNSSNQYRPSNTWRNMRAGEMDSTDGPEDSSSAEGGASSNSEVRAPPKAAAVSSSTRYYDQGDVQGQSLMSGSFPDAAQSSGLQFVDQTGEKADLTNFNPSGYDSSSRGSGDNGTTSSGSSSGGSTPPPENKAWNKRQMV
eukprot:CAMPEP_0172473904 /NCGR_PEP_ID=MMETSP1065-20121228/69090_1 /TAXON_ID=265537 /ORGANISM="Amphiprora paludosa, Strain CCMP125" /LENGTH=517 /DNA_ID=CAMNT_0013232081 /DNA_START=72 /DNA_END=1625 /DNA_ORIENTATION=-